MTEDFRDRPSMFDAHGTRIPLYPAEVRGPWRTRRTWVQAVLVVIFLILPWITINGAPAVLFDLEQRRFAFFGLQFWSHDGPLLFLVLGIIAIGLAITTALIGRAWCGWACPQTVFLDGVIRRIERLFEGNHLQRRALAAAPPSVGKAARKVGKWLAFAAFTALLTHSFLAYFFGADRVLSMITSDPRQNWGPFVFILFINGLMLFDLGWFREQFCLIVCPYGRIQSVLLDRQTVTVQYDAARGEPRRKPGMAAGTPQGACVACNRCVAVCPTGVDIRNGIQMECISCTACIDACDEIMRKTQQPEGLIRYKATTSGPVRWFRSRVLLYAGVLVALIAALAVNISRRHTLDLTVLRALDVPYLERVDEQGVARITNSYRLHVHNQSGAPLRFAVALAHPEELPGSEIRVPDVLLDLKNGEFRMIPFVIEAPKEALKGRDTVPLQLRIHEKVYEVQFVGPRP